MSHQAVTVPALLPQSPGTTVWIYRNAIKALPWMTSVRTKLLDPAYHQWFLPFSGAGNYSVPVCDPADPSKCSKLYHGTYVTHTTHHARAVGLRGYRDYRAH
jgi:hypothetical protein